MLRAAQGAADSAFKVEVKSRVSDAPIFGANAPVVVKIKFFLERPYNHFRNKDRLNPLKAGLPFARVSKPDIDNLAKFVDGMNEIVYQDLTIPKWSSWLSTSCSNPSAAVMGGQSSTKFDENLGLGCEVGNQKAPCWATTIAS